MGPRITVKISQVPRFGCCLEFTASITCPWIIWQCKQWLAGLLECLWNQKLKQLTLCNSLRSSNLKSRGKLVFSLQKRFGFLPLRMIWMLPHCLCDHSGTAKVITRMFGKSDWCIYFKCLTVWLKKKFSFLTLKYEVLFEILVPSKALAATQIRWNEKKSLKFELGRQMNQCYSWLQDALGWFQL